jgi:hypothetical protein
MVWRLRRVTTERLIWQSETDAAHAFIVAFDDIEEYRARGYRSPRLFVTTADHMIGTPWAPSRSTA